MIKSYFLPTGIMAGAVIGAGIFSLPFVFVQIGVLNGLIFLAALTWVVVLSHLYYADLVIRTKGRHNFVGLARFYFGPIGYWLGILTSVIQMFLVLVIYLILSQSFVNLIFGQIYPISLYIFWGLATSVIFLKLRRFAAVESLIVSGIIIIVGSIFLLSLSEWTGNILSVNWQLGISWPSFLLIVGPVVFALGGRSAVVEVVEAARRRPRTVWWSVVVGTVAPAIIYALFVMAVVLLSDGLGVTEDAVTGLLSQVDYFYLFLIGIFGLLGIFNSYSAIGYDVNNILTVDMKWPLWWRLLALALVPIGLYLLGLQGFLKLVSFSGGVFGSLVVIFVALMWWRAQQMSTKKNNLVTKSLLFRGNHIMPILATVVVFGVILFDQLRQFWYL